MSSAFLHAQLFITSVLLFSALIVISLSHYCDRLIKIQKKALRVVNLSRYNAHCDPLFKRFKILKLTDLLKLQELKTYFKFVHSELPTYLLELPFDFNVTIHNHNTRGHKKYMQTLLYMSLLKDAYGII